VIVDVQMVLSLKSVLIVQRGNILSDDEISLMERAYSKFHIDSTFRETFVVLQELMKNE